MTKPFLRMFLVLLPAALVLAMLARGLNDPELTASLPVLGDYYRQNFVADTGASSAVAAILLDYRLFDSLFEAGILLIAVTGIVFMVKNK